MDLNAKLLRAAENMVLATVPRKSGKGNGIIVGTSAQQTMYALERAPNGNLSVVKGANHKNMQRKKKRPQAGEGCRPRSAANSPSGNNHEYSHEFSQSHSRRGAQLGHGDLITPPTSVLQGPSRLSSAHSRCSHMSDAGPLRHGDNKSQVRSTPLIRPGAAQSCLPSAGVSSSSSSSSNGNNPSIQVPAASFSLSGPINPMPPIQPTPSSHPNTPQQGPLANPHGPSPPPLGKGAYHGAPHGPHGPPPGPGGPLALPPAPGVPVGPPHGPCSTHPSGASIFFDPITGRHIFFDPRTGVSAPYDPLNPLHVSVSQAQSASRPAYKTESTKTATFDPSTG